MARQVKSRYFPPADAADEHGIVQVGGALSIERLLDAYRHGIFPWPMFGDGEPMLWWSPDPRGIFEFDQFHVSRRLERTCRSGKFRVTSDQDIAGVLHGCATADDRRGGTWLTESMIHYYQQLNALGVVHSVEVWQGDDLVGGTYGVTMGGLFAGESMFHRTRDASKVALAHLVRHLQRQGYRLFDIQQLNPHTESLGGIEIPRVEFLQRLRSVIDLPVLFGTINGVWT
ncbi:MAG: leucyl/phenylalanyl-tRNA--protein transferase [Planctomycetota bacterium]|nr:leucyl/phenylalanyl-tRNA--protein transferase [Planctomycetota bacterium]